MRFFRATDLDRRGHLGVANAAVTERREMGYNNLQGRRDCQTPHK